MRAYILTGHGPGRREVLVSRGVLLGVHDERSGLDAENVIDMLRHHAAILGWDGYRKRQRRA